MTEDMGNVGTAVEPSVAEQLANLRAAAVEDLKDAVGAHTTAQRSVVTARARMETAATIAMETGVDVDTVASVVGLSKGTVRSWATNPGT